MSERVKMVNNIYYKVSQSRMIKSFIDDPVLSTIGFFLTIMFGSFAFMTVYFSIVFFNEMRDADVSVSYCTISATNKQGYDTEYQLNGIKRWKISNKVIGIYPTASEAFNMAKSIDCDLR